MYSISLESILASRSVCSLQPLFHSSLFPHDTLFRRSPYLSHSLVLLGLEPRLVNYHRSCYSYEHLGDGFSTLVTPLFSCCRPQIHPCSGWPLASGSDCSHPWSSTAWSPWCSLRSFSRSHRRRHSQVWRLDTSGWRTRSTASKMGRSYSAMSYCISS